MMSCPKDELLAAISREFSEKVKESIEQVDSAEEPISEDIKSRILTKYSNVFTDLLDQGFSATFRSDLLPQSGSQDQVINTSVTEGDLLRLDEAIQQAVARRSQYPSRLNAYIDKTLSHKAETAKDIQTNLTAEDVLTVVQGSRVPPDSKPIDSTEQEGKEFNKFMVLSQQDQDRADRAKSLAKQILK